MDKSYTRLEYKKGRHDFSNLIKPGANLDDLELSWIILKGADISGASIGLTVI